MCIILSMKEWTITISNYSLKMEKVYLLFRFYKTFLWRFIYFMALLRYDGFITKGDMYCTIIERNALPIKLPVGGGSVNF
jgi:hypothetical protein